MRSPFLTATTVAAALAFAVPAVAQSSAPEPSSKPAIGDESALERDYQLRDQSFVDGGQTAMAASDDARPEDLAGLPVHDASGERIGEVADVEVGPSGDINRLIVAQGGLNGGAKIIAIEWDNAQLDDDRVLLDMTGSQVSELPDHQDPTAQ